MLKVGRHSVKFNSNYFIPMELNTWILGQTFVQVSDAYSFFAIFTKKLSLAKVVGRRS